MEIALLTAIIIGALILYVTRVVAIEVTGLLIITSLALTGVLEPSEALQGFSSTATITVAAMFVLSAGLTRTGVVEYVTKFLSAYSTMSLPRLLLALGVTVAFMSAFANNTPVVIIMVPVLLKICRTGNIASSKIFMPVSYFAIMGGTCTLIGTSTNILIDDLFRKAGGEGFGIFDFTPVGILYLLVGMLVVIVLAPRLLPERTSLASLLQTERTAKFVTELVLRSGSPLIGKRVGDILTKDVPVRLLEVFRGEEIILAGRAQDLVLEPDDALIVEGSPKDISAFLGDSEGVELASVVEDERRVPMRTIELRLVEAVILPDSPYAGRYVRDLGLNRLYGVKVMAVQRHGRQHRYQIRAMRLHEGDVLLLQADDNGLAALRETGAMLIVEGVEETVHRHHRKPLAIAIMAAVIVAATVLGLPLVVCALLGAALMMITGCLRVDEAVRALDFPTLFLLAGTIPLGVAMLKTGLAPLIVSSVLDLIGSSQPHLLVAILYILTAILTSFLSNTAAAVLLVPIAVDMAATLGVAPQPLLMAVAFGASASFSTPIGYQTNAIVMGPGGYTFGDYMRLGLPLTLILWITATFLIPFIWPL